MACGEDAEPARTAALEGAGVTVWPSAVADGRVDLGDVLGHAAREGLISVLSEGGGLVASSLLACGLVDRVAFFIAPRLYGTPSTPGLSSIGDGWLKRKFGFVDGTWTKVGDDCLYEATVEAATGEED